MVRRTRRANNRLHDAAFVAVPRLHECPKKKARPLADAVGTFGIEILGRIDYATRVGLILNQSRVEKRRAFTFIEALGSALSGNIDKSFFEAMAHTPEQADASYQVFEARRQMKTEGF